VSHSAVANAVAHDVYPVAVCVVVWQSAGCRVSSGRVGLVCLAVECFVQTIPQVLSLRVLWFSGGFVTE